MLWKLHRYADQQPALELIDAHALGFDPHRRRVVLFPGTGLDDRCESATKAGSIKYVEQTLSSSLQKESPPVDILLNSYELPYEDFGAMRPHYRLDRVQSHYGMGIARNVLIPLILAPHENLSSLTPETLKERLSTLTLVGHSYGSIAIQDSVNSLVHKLRQIGWSDETIHDTLKELVAINVAPISRTDFPAPNCTQYFFNAYNDMTAIDCIRNANPHYKDYVPLLDACGYGRAATALRELGENAKREPIREHIKTAVEKTYRPGVMPRAAVKPRPNQYVISALLPDDEIRWSETRWDGTETCRVINREEEQRTQVSVVHDYRNYLHGNHTLGEVLINVANNAVQREVGIGDGHGLMLHSPLTRAHHAHRHEMYAKLNAEAQLTTPAETEQRR